MPDPITRLEPVAPAEDTSIRPGRDTLKAALDRKRDFLIAMPAEQVTTGLKLDASSASGVVIAAAPRITAHRDAIRERFGPEGVALVDDLPTVAYACEQADTEAKIPEDGAELSAMARQIQEDHDLLVTEADGLANRKLLDRARIEPGRPIQGYRTMVKSTLILVELFRTIWPQIEGKTFLAPADLDRIADRAKDMLDALHLRENGVVRAEAVELRTRALNHLVQVYGEVRRMVSYVRWWHDDADDIAPSLYANRRRSRNGATEPSTPVVSPTPDPANSPATPIDPIPGGGPLPFTS